MVGQRPPKSNTTLTFSRRLIIIAGLFMIGGSCIAFFVNPKWMPKAHLGLILGAMLILSVVFLQPDIVRTALVGREANSVVKSVAFIIILLFINLISLQNNYEYDLTTSGRFTLSQQTIETLNSLSKPVQVIGFFHTGDAHRDLAQDYLERYTHYTEKLTYSLYDAQIEAALAQSYNFTHNGLLFISGMHHYEIYKINEQTITSGLICVANQKCKPKSDISIPAKSLSNNQISLTPTQVLFTLISTVIVMPLTVFVVGIKIWWGQHQT